MKTGAIISIFLFGLILGNIWGSHAVRTTIKQTKLNSLNEVQEKVNNLKNHMELAGLIPAK